MDWGRATDSHRDDKVDMGNPWTKEESDAVSCIKGDHAGTVAVKRKASRVKNNNTQSGSGRT